MSYEALGDERFQRFCQSLLTYEHPDLRCFPLNQADGGRDALADGIVFQVKYSTDPASVKDPVTWLKRAIARERPKMDALIVRGARSYCLITNVSGTGRLDAGSMDRIEAVLQELPFEQVSCWWRDDLDVRFAKHAFALKWTYRELLTAQDLLEGLLLGPLGEDRQRRARAIRSFLARQHADDAEIRLRQVEFRASFPDAWLDLSGTWTRPEGAYTLHSVAEYLLRDEKQQSRALVYGAPGQGKSTLGQFVCQIHRRRLLELEMTGWPHQHSPIRLPIRVDVKDLAEHLDGGDPFRLGQARSAATLLGFLADLIGFVAGGDRFDVSDLKASLEGVSVLLVLDGLDEVPQVELRSLVIEEIDRGLASLEPFTGAIQAVLATRPAQYGSHDLLDARRWDTITLADLTPNEVRDYARRWLGLQELSPRERDGYLEVLDNRLRDGYFADLVRNGMQVTIVLRLLMILESWLPERRAELYGEYFRVYMMREAGKSAIVAEHANTLRAFHRLLGFRLHVQAQDGARPEIATEELKALLATALAHTTTDRTLIDVLFDGVVERIAVIVSRRDGFFEFEVQPMREYFAAQHLYATAPEARYGKAIPGTKRDIFLALAKDRYWTNVLRFFAGEFSEGESNSLAFDLLDFGGEPGWSETERPREVTAQLLNDRVFYRSEGRAMAVEELVIKIPHRTCLDSGSRGHLTDPEVARQVLDAVVEAIADPATPVDRRQALTLTASQHRATLHPERLYDQLQDVPPERGERLLRLLGELNAISRDNVHRVCELPWLSNETALMLLAVGGDVAASDPYLVEAALRGALESSIDWLFRVRADLEPFHPVVALAAALSGTRPAFELARGWPRSPEANDAYTAVVAFIGVHASAARDPLELIASLVRALGQRRRGPAFDRALLTAVARARLSAPNEVDSLPRSVALVTEARWYAERNNAAWWSIRRDRGRSRLLAQIALVYAGPAILQTLGAWIEESLEGFTDEQIARCLALVIEHGSPVKLMSSLDEELLSPLGATALALRAYDHQAALIDAVVHRDGALTPGNSGAICVALLGSHRSERRALSSADLDVLRRAYAARPVWMAFDGKVSLSRAHAETVLSDPGQFPIGVVRAAEMRVLEQLERETTLLGHIATNDGWFGTG